MLKWEEKEEKYYHGFIRKAFLDNGDFYRLYTDDGKNYSASRHYVNAVPYKIDATPFEVFFSLEKAKLNCETHYKTGRWIRERLLDVLG